MSYNSGAVATELVSILSGLSGMGASQIGAFESVAPRVASYVTMGSQNTSLKTSSGIMQRETRFFVMFVYRVDGAEATAETTLMGLVDAFMQAIQADFTLGGTVTKTEANSLAADEPDYQLRAGKEYREYPVTVLVRQYDTFDPNP